MYSMQNRSRIPNGFSFFFPTIDSKYFDLLYYLFINFKNRLILDHRLTCKKLYNFQSINSKFYTSKLIYASKKLKKIFFFFFY